ncbi:L,D-transpeptidase [Flaviflagellibacter deserti]|uniref:L,D-transpeptidase n=1 Tax=Flaviflagellibacter deserti TaxID=2267266 RepID=A0ABV9YYM5_9HYPH
MTSTSGRVLTRRLFLAGMAGTLAACQQTTASGSKPAAALPTKYAALYSPLPNERFPIPGVPANAIKPAFVRQQVTYATAEPPGTIIVDPGAKYLYLVEEGGTAMRYGVGVGREGFGWNGSANIARKAEWPRWTPPAEMIVRQPELAEWKNGMDGSLSNPLGARALYLYQGGRDTLYRLHGTNEPRSIGSNVSSGCVRLINQDIIDLYQRTPVGTRVVVLGTAGVASA